jgi:hypothetical protein
MKRKRIVTAGNLDDRLAVAEAERHRIEQLADERWVAHKDSHAVIADALREYKREANEWRSTLSDLRSSFLPKNEFLSEHRALDAKLHGEIIAALAKVEALDTRLDAVAGDVKTTSTEQIARRSVFTDSRNIVSAAALIFGVIASALLLLDRLNPQ